MKYLFSLFTIFIFAISSVHSQNILEYFPIPEEMTSSWTYVNTENRQYSVHAVERGIGYRQMAVFSSTEYEYHGIEGKFYILNNDVIYQITPSAGEQDPILKAPGQIWSFSKDNIFVEYESTRSQVGYKIGIERNGAIQNINVRFTDCIKIKRRLYENGKYVKTEYFYYAKNYGLVRIDEKINDKNVSSYLIDFNNLTFPDYDQFEQYDDNKLLSFIDEMINNFPKNSNEMINIFGKNNFIANNNIFIIGKTFSIIFQAFLLMPENNKPFITFDITFLNKEEGLKSLIDYLENKYKIYAMKTEEQKGLDKSIIHYNIALRPNRNVTMSINYDSDDSRNVNLFFMDRN